MTTAMATDLDVCSECGKSFDRSAITNSDLDSFGLDDDAVLVRAGRSPQGGVHLHGVTISAPGSLTVRFAVRRYWHYKALRLRWRLRSVRSWRLSLSR